MGPNGCADTVTVSPSAGTTGPSTSLSDGGCPTPRSGGVPRALPAPSSQSLSRPPRRLC